MKSVEPTHRPTWPRTALALLVVATCARVWSGPITVVEEAQAQIPDSGLQRKQLLEEARRTNELLLEIKQLLATQTLNVRIRSADNP